MFFNVYKCKVIYHGSRYYNYSYNILRKPLKVETEDFDVCTIRRDLESTQHCKSVCKKANTILGLIEMIFESKTPGASSGHELQEGHHTIGGRAAPCHEKISLLIAQPYEDD